ncbi:hypothetical protein EHI8A_017250 [Entamoeba histolytica HM-1:IMSS-B]|uniref:Uncharacterized protein n=6 Tax=Entamoeba histolytica TaxID=5759 RepID=C4LY53_ENTH1|nr:hypothetical protein EHI_177500 [Entamoeba histolytica HM-1:IMSS]EAL50535.2 hypothetical protein EHI_177500 [Entamoeba histolytica HM-1:IMSS]EMD46879.1 Hypothetical protein EHI5A_031730 [Entamoeba histolytica KU27]EMH75742.1 hypothetical protein EHI8A_017250 [Entamoeba histolytica HM-1:IMSS-B]ENY65158.1 hypothetical protein EHI7A_018490 [Entamoeba histolytica HM-1:IMSS-A]|eukprot:XP_655920.2 hypothetical protein EHI_177500 [Entamoeba histolytica HM-1:IMSS]
MRFKTARKAGVYLQRGPIEYQSKKNSKRVTSVNEGDIVKPKVIEVCIPVSCENNEILDTNCVFNTSYKIACGYVSENKCTPISIKKPCKTKKNVIYISSKRKGKGTKIYNIKAFEDSHCLKPYQGFTENIINCKFNNLKTKKFGCNPENEISVGGICECKNCRTENIKTNIKSNDQLKIKRSEIKFGYNPWFCFFIPGLVVIVVVYFFTHKKPY